MPIFSGLAGMLPHTSGTRVMLSVAKRTLAIGPLILRDSQR